MRGHTGGCITLGWGMLHIILPKQKLNTKSLTECEVIGTSDHIPFPIWFQYFNEIQYYKLQGNELNQDNTSTIRLEKNGKMSSVQQTRHINIRYLLLKIESKKTILVFFIVLPNRW